MTDFARYFCVDSTCLLSCGSDDSYGAPITQDDGHRGIKRSIDVVSVSMEEDEKPPSTGVNKQRVHMEVSQPKAESFYVVQKDRSRESVQVNQAQAFDSYFSGPYRVPLADNEDNHAQQNKVQGSQRSSAPSKTSAQSACYVIHDEETISSIFRSCRTEESSTQQHNARKPGLVLPDTKEHNYHIVQRC